MSKTPARQLAVYYGRVFLGSMKITMGVHLRLMVKVRDRTGKPVGTFKNQKTGLTAIDCANDRRFLAARRQ